MPKTRTAYPPAFRQQMIELVRAGRSPELTWHAEFEPTAQTIRNWVAQADPKVAATTVTTVEREELRRLPRRLREEREILSKATAWFARETDSRKSSNS